jgi:glycosyltransferase involved in cell wall biosynthesis
MKRILFLGDAGSSHLTKWVQALHGKYYKVGIFSLREPAAEIRDLEGLTIHVHQTDQAKFSASFLSKFVYMFAVPALRKFVSEFKPDVIHAHYASSYGLMGARLNFHPYIISAWGSDVFSFADNQLGKLILQYNFKKADAILSTSYVMKDRVASFTSKPIIVTPFGVDTHAFHPAKNHAPFFPQDAFVFGMVKSMEDIYGVSNVISAFHQLLQKGNECIRLLLVGSGTMMEKYQAQCIELGIENYVHFAGRINHADVPKYHQMMDVFLNPSRMESFGVSVLEAMACGNPVIVTHIGGLKEIVQDRHNGLHVAVDDAADLAQKMEMLLTDEQLRGKLAQQALRDVHAQYSWEKSVEIMVKEVYQTYLK